MLECIPNVSEGRDAQVLDRLTRACGPPLLDRHVDPDHHRTVLTIVGEHDEVADATRSLARAVAANLDLRDHHGVHPRLGALDVVPFVALDDDPASAVAAATAFARWIATELAVPAFCYDEADPSRRSLPETRRDAFVARAPDYGPLEPHPLLGAVAVGARPPLIACNCWLDTADVALARAVAAAVRERDGGLPGVRALGLALPSQGVSQVAMNLVDLGRTGMEAACGAVRRAVEDAGHRVTRVELVGLMPAAELERCSAAFRGWAGLDDRVTIEGRLAARSTPDGPTST